MPDLDDDELTALVDADFPRVDLVGKGANGIPRFLIAKQDADSRGLVPPDLVRELIGKQAAPGPEAEDTVTVKGTPAAIAKLIHGAPVRPAGTSPEEAAVAVAAVAKDMAPELDEGVDGMDPTVPLAAPEDDAPGDPADPGSPAWEAIDAATAQKWTSIAVRLKNALCVLADREMIEAATADPDDAENAWDLQDAMCAVDYVISTLAVFAAGEQAEADLGGEALEAIGKAMAGFDPAPLTVIEGLCAVAKSGRVLSSANETHIREAAQALTTVLSSLPQAPVTDDGQPVAKKEATVADTQTPAAVAKTDDGGQTDTSGTDAPEGGDVRKSALTLVYDQGRSLVGVANAAEIVQQVAKADGEKTPMQAVFDQNGDLIGIVNPDSIQPVTGAGKPPAADAAAADEDTATADPADMTPAPAAETGTPADAVADDGTVAKQDGTIKVTQDVLKSIAQDAARTALEAQGAAHAEVVAKMAADNAGVAEELKVVKARLETVENSPAAPKVFTNGQVPPADQLRGQNQGAQPVDVAKAMERRRQFLAADPAEQNGLANEMQQDAIGVLAALHRG